LPDRAAAFRNRLDGLLLAEIRQATGLGSFLGGRIALFPHQLDVAERATASDPVRRTFSRASPPTSTCAWSASSSMPRTSTASRRKSARGSARGTWNSARTRSSSTCPACPGARAGSARSTATKRCARKPRFLRLGRRADARGLRPEDWLGILRKAAGGRIPDWASLVRRLSRHMLAERKGRKLEAVAAFRLMR
jgi:hypothetical protein